MDLSPFTQINPCGFEGLKTVDMQTLGIEDNIDIVGQQVVTHLLQLLQNRN